MEQQTVTGIAFSRDEAQISVRQVQDKPGVAAAIFMPLAEANINVDMIVQNVSADGKTTDLTFTVPAADYQRSLDIIAKAKQAIGYTGSTAPPTSPRFPSSASACAAMPASPRRHSRRSPSAQSISAPSPPRRSSFRC